MGNALVLKDIAEGKVNIGSKTSRLNTTLLSNRLPKCSGRCL